MRGWGFGAALRGITEIIGLGLGAVNRSQASYLPADDEPYIPRSVGPMCM